MRHSKIRDIEEANSCSLSLEAKSYHLHRVRTLPFYVRSCQGSPLLLI